MLDLDRFIADCRATAATERSHRHIRDVVARAVSRPGEILMALGEPEQAGLHKLYESSHLTILNVVLGPDDDHHAA